ncbi:heme-degrading monooxygenase HmoB [Paraliobacillus ryukyuensis]|uniref:ABM domain-containing protein n=1 Tax=Paraliobacillus ryukyuensis TaxID=200904 RepID=A0A366EA06_9BACI|nr:antibiotic biosynthesis monooxygenase [Paraliobacillus ryukyuensis]RBO98248.1 hypothetical protein DES48_10598 [Paraliobacillus ryukyuensis]
MKAYMTNGTLPYLEHIALHHPELTITLMERDNSTLAYYEIDQQVSLFREARIYDVLMTYGELQQQGIVTMRHIPLTDDGKPVFEAEWKKNNDVLKKQEELFAYRVLKPLYGNTYVVMMQWKNRDAFHQWDVTNLTNEHIATDYRAGRAFTTYYTMVDWEEEQ